MTSLIEKVANLLPVLEERGKVYLFAFAEREDIDRWDVILSSEWSDKDWAGAVRLIADQLGTRLEPHEKTIIARIAVVPSDNPTMQELPASLDGVMPSDNKVIHVKLLGSDIRQAFVFKAQHPPAAIPGGSLADVVAVHS